ncbi:M20/M25/M40 family metallo-hydrolase [Phenylobacterium sp.]|uniref:M20/M25/M40 family metallo-hydrolase n=1 Tax=Phenylobacterium sp. TaxID=1871053 RepID=UPI0025D6C559|nr:M20/M25/M40 family metallo-hydrolase [Phenylobacterium sp.]MBX3484738.1 M20/M25/M40 family metallo-hydrolase [Phenylobacterium sp.]MCW5760629.1 M20/M25/M40 family metallo-hydrolase [Phenylobacterium sp.]
MFGVSRHVLAAVLSLTVALPLTAGAATPGAADRTIAAIRKSPGFKAAQAALDADHDRIVAETIQLTEIPAPPFKETARGQAYMAMLKAAGLTDVEMDAEGNVMGLRRGTGAAGGPVVVLAAHLDTVFPEGTDVKVRREGTRLHAPGVGDDTHSLAVVLGYVRALDAAKIRTRKDILFVGNVGEEGPGDLRGTRFLFGKGKYKDRIAAFFSMDGTSADRVTYGAVGSRRYRVTFKGPGGHSYGAFGLVNPMAAMGTTVVEMNKIRTPAQPKTTYMTSVVGGGTSVNSIPDAIWLEVDMRSESKEELAKIDGQFLAIVKQAVEQENAARSTRAGAISAEVKQIGDRPTGATKEDAEIVQLTSAAVKAAGYTPILGASSTDSNVPISLGIPAVTIGSGGEGGRAHAPDEWIDVSKPESLNGMSVGLAALLAVAGT